ncbi:hypothetical protein H4R20_002251 [Coemansia guatemalensis]|uniref:BZIP domain-containing protein n=1 Tax=Coemansia guatemalensis TaxID=2761395 RepID=A0A9W8HY44_9FUNG|nr:hypothetical protein H4R20_002251 [Coemansia guatemalensis]
MSAENDGIGINSHSHLITTLPTSSNGRMVTRGSRLSNVIPENEILSSEPDDYFALDCSDSGEASYAIEENSVRGVCNPLGIATGGTAVMQPRDSQLPAASSFGSVDATTEGILPEETGRAQSPRTARRQRNRLAAARMRTRQKQHLAQLEKRKEGLERRAAQLEEELRMVQRQNSPYNSSIDKLAEMVDDLTRVEHTMLTGIDECKSLLQNLESLCELPQ